MTLLEYVQTLSSDISVGEKIALTKAWKNKNQSEIEEEVIETPIEEVVEEEVIETPIEEVVEEEVIETPVKEVKTNGAAETDAAVVPTPEASESSDSGSGTSYSMFDEEAIASQSLDIINQRALNYKDQQDEIKRVNKLAKAFELNLLVPSIIPRDEPIEEGDDPGIYTSLNEKLDDNAYIGPYKQGYKPVPLEVQIKKYDELIKKEFKTVDGKLTAYSREESQLLTDIIKKRNSLAKSLDFVEKVNNSPSNLELENTRNEDGSLKEVSQEAFYDKESGRYLKGSQQELPKASEKQAFENYKARTGKDASSFMQLTDEDYTLTKEQDPFGAVLATVNQNTENKEQVNAATELGKKIESWSYRFGGKVLSLPSWWNQQLFTIAAGDKSLAAINALPYEERSKVLNKIAGKIGLVDTGEVANYLFDLSEKMFKASTDVDNTLATYDQGITESFGDVFTGDRSFVSTMKRLSTDALGSAGSLVEVAIPGVGIPLLIVGEASASSREKQKEGDDLSLALSGYSIMVGAAEGALEAVTRGIAKKAFGFKPSSVDDAFKSLLKFAGEVGVDFAKEGASESGTFLLTELAEYWYTGNEVDFNKKFLEMMDTFIVGGAFGAKISSFGAAKVYIKQGATNRLVNNKLDSSEFDSISTVFETVSIGSDVSVEIAGIDGSLQLLNTQLKAEVNNGNMLKGEADIIKQNFIDVQTSANALSKAGINAKNQAPLTALLIEKNKLQQKIKDVNDSDVTESNGDQARLNEIKTEIQELVIQDTVIDIESSKTREGARLIAEQLGAKFENYGTQAEYDARVKELAGKGAEVQKSLGYGQAVEFGGETIILINDRVAAERNKYTTDQHELLHPFFKQTFQNNPELAVTFGKSLITEILNNKQIQGGAEMRARLQDYIDDENYSAEMTYEEVIPLVSESITNGDIVYNEKTKGFFEALRDKISNVFKSNKKQPLNIEFNTGLDIFNFLKDYNNTINSGNKLNEAQLKVAKEGAKGKLVDGIVEKVDGRTKGARETKSIDSKLAEVELARVESEAKDIIAKESKLESNISPRGAELTSLVKEGLITNEGLVDIINSPSSKPVDKFGAIDAVVESNWPVISNSIKFNPTGSIPIEAVKTAVTEQIQGIFPGRKKELFKDFDLSRDNKVTTILGPKFLGMRQAEILQRASEIAATSTDGESIDSDKAKQVIDTSTTTFKSDGSSKKPIAQTDATSFGPAKNKKQDLESIIQVKDADRPNFKSLNNKYFNEVAENLFGIEGKKVRGNASLKYSGTKGNPTSSEANALQNVFKNSDNVRSFIKTMPKYNVATKETIINKQGESIDVSRDTYGRALGINPKVLEVFYDEVTGAIPDISSAKGRSLGKTTQPPVYKIKPEFDAELGLIGKQAITKLQSLIGVTPAGELSIPVKGPARTEFGSALTGLSKMYVDNVINTIGRSKLDSKQAKADAGAGKPKSMASKLESYDAMPPKLKTAFKEVSVLKNKKQLAASLGFNSPPINDSNRVAQQNAMQKAVVKHKLDTATIEAGMMGSGGKQTFYGVKGGKMYSSAKQAFDAGIENAVKFGKTTDGKFVEINTKGVTNWVAKPGRLYYGKSDPAYKELIKSAQAYNGPKTKRITPARAFSKNPKTRADAKQESENNMEVLTHVVTQLSNAVADGMSLDIAAAIIIQSYQATSGLVKISAPFKYRSTFFRYGGPKSKKQQREGNKYREEHNPPASVVGASIILAIKNNAATPTMKAIKENYYQTQLSKFDDDLLDQAKLDSTLVEGQSVFNNPITRLAAAGIDLNTIENPDTGKTIAEESGFGIDPKVYAKYNANEKLQASSIQNEAILETIEIPDYDAAKIIKASLPLVQGKSMASKLDSDLIPESIEYSEPITVQKAINALEKTDKALANGRKLDQPVKKIRVFDFDDTLARTKSNVLYTMPDGTTGAIDAATFAKEAGNMEAEGAQWDFSEFSKVMQGSKGPLLDVAKIIADKRGTKDVFVLTARPANAAGPIKEFLASMGLDIPLANITGLGDGTPQAKAGWIMGKAAEGYNDFYFADDHTGNVKAVKDVLSQIDVKSKVQLAKASKIETFDTIVNHMIEDSSGIETYKQYSAARAKTVGASKGKFNFFIPPSAEDFTGLLYKMLGKGKKGDAQMAFLKANLLDPYDRAESAVTQAKISAANDFKALKTELKTLPTSLSVPTGIGGFTYSHAVRTAIWTAQGMEIPGLSKKDIKELNDFVQNDPELRVFANELIKIQKGKPYPKPGKDWLGGNITSDIINDINKVNRAEYQQEWRENVDIIFSETNMNKMEAAYGTRWRNAMEDSLRRMKSGSNRPPGGNRSTDAILDWLNNSVGAVMFLNTRSALLQTISAVNFINWGDNNIVKAGAAFANQKQFWADFMTLMNSDYLVERRNGLKINVSESEIADAVRDSGNKPKAAIAFLLSKGFVMTRFADSFAIATGGSTFYRNRVKALVAKGMDQKAAEAQAFSDFRQIAEESQQSSNPNRISAQQASSAGRVILAWANTPMQYARIQKRSAQDLINGRGDWKTNVSKIVYYGAIQNLIFNSLQQAVFALGFGEDDEEKDAKKNEKISRVANGMIDSQLKGLGIGGAAVLALKSALMELGKQHAKKSPEYEEAVFDLLNFSPPLGSKINKIRGGLRSFSWNMEDMKEKGFSLDNPAYLAGAQIVTGLTNLPLDRVMKKINNVRGMVNEQSAHWQKVALGLGWSTWDLGLGYYGGFDAAKVLTADEEKAKEIDDMKKLTKTKEQVDMLLDLGLSKKEIKALGKEQNRVEKIIELQNAEAEPKKEAEVKEEIKEETKPTPVAKPKPTPKPKVKTVSAEARLRRQFDSIKDENKPDQVKTLLKFGLSKKEIRALKYEKNRVEKILELMPKNK